MKKKFLIIIPILTLCIVLFTAQSSEPVTKVLTRKYAEINFDLNVDEVLGDFKKTLLQQGILDNKDLSNPSAIYDKLSEIEGSADPRDFGIQGFIEKKPLTELLDTEDILSLSPQVQADVALFTYYQLYSAKYCEFVLYLNDKRLIQFEDEELPMNSFESVLFEAISDRSHQNVSVKNVKMIINADPLTPTEYVNFITKKLREMDLRALTYK